MPELLTNDPNVADALLDMSNILRAADLGGRGAASLSRMFRVGEALASFYGADQVKLFGVADRSLLDRPDLISDFRHQQMLRRWETDGLILVEGKADNPLLQIAEETGLPIITRDRFVGHRREYRWLDGSEDAVLEPTGDGQGGVRLRRVTLEQKYEWEISIGEERDLFVQQGLLRRREALGRYWKCPEQRCPRHDPKNSRIVLLPRRRGGRLICDLHGLDMIDLGPRPQAAQLKIMHDGQERGRFTVTEGAPVTVGRSADGINLLDLVDRDVVRDVSRFHLRLEFDEGRLTITDTSRNGTTLIFRNGAELELRDDSRPFSAGDRAQFHPGLEIVRSGRRYPSELQVRGWIPLPRTDDEPSELTVIGRLDPKLRG
jgi:hypothetical protein